MFICVSSSGLSPDKAGKTGGRGGEERKTHFTFSACSWCQTADLHCRHARAGNCVQIMSIPKDYMKRPRCFKVVQLDYPFHFFLLACIQDADIQQKKNYTASYTHVKEHTHTLTAELGQKGKRWGERVKEEAEMSEKEIRMTSKHRERDLQP